MTIFLLISTYTSSITLHFESKPATIVKKFYSLELYNLENNFSNSMLHYIQVKDVTCFTTCIQFQFYV